MIFQNYHRHTYYTNPIVADSCASNEQYAQRAQELGHGIISTCEHGSQGRYIEGYELAQKYNLKFVFGTEAYWVKDRFEKDNSNCHIYIAAKNENGRQAINDILSEANLTGYYYRPRIDLPLIFSLPKDDVIVSTACVAYWKYEDIDNITYDLHNYFGANFYLEVQYHNTEKQKDINRKIIDLSNRYNIAIIMGCDSHYIDLKHHSEREDYLLSKGIKYEDEEGWYLDYPDGETAKKRFEEQGVLSNCQIIEAIENTNVFLTVEEYKNPCFTKEIKMPIIYPDKTQEERNEIFLNILRVKWIEERKKIPKEKWGLYVEEIKKEIDTVIGTNHADYFLLDYELVKEGKKMGGVITPSGRGSGVSFYINKLLGLTMVDRIAADVKMYPERFMSKTRILEAGTLADIDLNLGTVQIFADAQTKILGEGHSYPMLAYGTLKPKAAWKMYAKSQNIDFNLANEVSKQIEKYDAAVKRCNDEDERNDIDILEYIDKEYHEVYLNSKVYQGIISDQKIHPCLTEKAMILTNEGYRNINDIKIGDCVLTHTGKFQKVLNTMNRISEDYYELKIGGRIIEVTGNHPVLVITNTIDSRGSILKRSLPYWKKVEDLTKNDLIGFSNINTEENIPTYNGLSTQLYDFWWLVGRYLGDGFLTLANRKKSSPIKRINISCHTNEINDIVCKLESLNIKYHIANKKLNAIEVAFYGKHYWNFLNKFGKYAYGKFLPEFVYTLPKNLMQGLVDGYMSADGHIGQHQSSFVTVSEHLALGMQICLQKIYYSPATLRERLPTIGTINAKTFLRRKAYIVVYSTNAHKKNQNIYFDNRAWCHASTKKIDKSVVVYNLEVENDNSYTADNIVFHNCSYLLYQGDIRKEIGLIKIKDNLCCLMDGKWAEDYKFLKNDLLKVSAVELIDAVYKRIGIKQPEVQELLALCPPNDIVWSIYKNAWTMGINQVEQPGTKGRVAKYAPKNISELCAFVAAIRPGFKSMYKKFENREDFSYGIKAVDNLIRTVQFPQSFMLYQEMQMAILNYAGIPMTECYEIIKNIAKKRKEKVFKYKEMFINGFKQKMMEEFDATNELLEDNRFIVATATQVWQILEDSAAYIFNSSHSYCVAVDSLYGAYLKSHYPLQFYEVFLNILEAKGEKDRLKDAKIEAEAAFKIFFPPMRFRQDNRAIVANEEKNEITMSLKSIKGFSELLADNLYELKDMEFKTFVDLLIHIEENYTLSTKIEDLIKLQFFQEFGNNAKLLHVYYEFKSGKNRYSRKLTDKSKNARIPALIELENTIPNENLKLKEQLDFENELLGYVQCTYDVNPRLGYVLEIDTKFAPRVEMYFLNSGKTKSLKIYKKDFNKKQLKIGDLVMCDITCNKPATKFVNGEYIENSNEIVTWLTKYSLFLDKRREGLL